MEEKSVVKFSVAEADIAKKSAIYMELEVDGPDDEEGFQAVDTARKVMKADRVAVQKREKELKVEANAWRKKVGNRAKELYALINPIEDHLKTQCKIVTDEKARIEKEEAEAFKKKIDIRMNTLAGYNTPLPYQEVATMLEDDYLYRVTAAEMAWEDEQARIAEEKRIEDERKAKVEAEQKAENERLEKIRIEQEEAAAKIKADQNKIDAEKAELRKEKDKVAKEAEDKQAAEDAKIQAEKDEKERVEREERKAEEEKKEAKAEIERQEALKPDKEKLLDWVKNFREIPDPVLKHKDSIITWQLASKDIYAMLDAIDEEIDCL